MKMNGSSAMKLAARALGKPSDPSIYLLSTVRFDSTSGLYTYYYIVDNRLGAVPIIEVNILINSTAADPGASPTAQTGPLGWSFHTAVSGASSNPPLNEFGTFWSWYDPVGVPAGTVSPVYSFTTPRQQTTFLNNNFFLFSNAAGAADQGIVSFGHILGPDFGVPPSPELVPSAGNREGNNR